MKEFDINEFGKDDLVIKEALSAVNFEQPNISEGVFSRLNQKHTKPRRKLVVACLFAVFVFGTAFTMNYSSFVKLLADLNPAFADYLDAVELSYEYDGIKMEVVAVGTFGNQLKAYVTLQDLTGNRVNEDIVYHMDFFGIKSEANLSGQVVRRAHYDKETGVLTIPVEAQATASFEGKDVTFKIKDIYSNERKYTGHDLGINLTDVSKQPETVVLKDEQFIKMISRNEKYYEAKTATVLKPNVMEIAMPQITSQKITNIGIVDGKLRMQVWKDYDYMGGFAEYYLKGKYNDLIKGEPVFSYNMDEKEGLVEWSNSLWEYEFDVDLKKLADYKLIANISESDKFAGEWEVTAKVKENEIKPIEALCNIDFEGFNVEKIRVTPFGVTLFGNGEIKSDWFSTNVVINEGESKNITKINSAYYDTQESGGAVEVGIDTEGYLSVATFDSEVPIDLDKITSVEIGGEVIKIK